jgi:hypothetical protein
MKSKLIVALCVAAVVVTAAMSWTQAADPSSTKPDPRIDKLLEQNEQILKNQAEILKNQAEMIKSLQQVETGVMSIRRRS